MNNGKDYLNYFSFLKNLKNGPDTGMSPLTEWHHVIQFFAKVYSYLENEWNINLDQTLDFTGCKVEAYSGINRHRQSIADIVVYEFRLKNNVSNTALRVVDYLKIYGLYNLPKE